ncbi:PAS domain-containing protein [Sporomusa carbonis]|uniref:PAS domain-containing protein n=1 Tax=Sporomusa carbonis TaxID=3076075 RepID=UPI003C7E08AE
MVILRKKLDSDFQASFNQTYIGDKDCIILFVSISGARSLGMKPSDMIGRHWRQLGMPAEIMEKFEQNLGAVITSGKPLIIETMFPTQHGLQYFDVNLRPLFNETGSVEAVISTVKNNAKNRLIEMELINQMKRLDQLIKKTFHHHNCRMKQDKSVLYIATILQKINLNPYFTRIQASPAVTKDNIFIVKHLIEIYLRESQYINYAPFLGRSARHSRDTSPQIL